MASNSPVKKRSRSVSKAATARRSSRRPSRKLGKAEADRLTKLLHGRVIVGFSPNNYIEPDEIPLESKTSFGHIYSVEVIPDAGDASDPALYLDDRRDGTLAEILAAELRRAAAVYESVARLVESATARKAGGR